MAWDWTVSTSRAHVLEVATVDHENLRSPGVAQLFQRLVAGLDGIDGRLAARASPSSSRKSSRVVMATTLTAARAGDEGDGLDAPLVAAVHGA